MKAWLENALTNSQVEYLSQVVADEQTEILEALQEFVELHQDLEKSSLYRVEPERLQR